MRTAKQIAQDLIVDLKDRFKDDVSAKIGIEEIIAAVRKEGYNPADVEGGQMVDAVTRQVVGLI